MTEENKLTLEDCFKYYKATIIYEQEKFFGIGDFFRCSNPTLNISDCKLILRTIEQLTDEEKRICDSFNKNASLTKILFVGKSLLTDTSRDLADNLRKIGIDIDGMFKSGKAAKDDK